MLDESSYFDVPGFQETALHEELVPLYSSESGLCELFRARRDGKIVVYKALKPQFRNRPEFESVLRKEFEIGYGLDHPGLCRVLSYESVAGLGTCIIMEWIDGCTLAEFCGSHKPDRKLIVKLISEMCDALEYLHSHQVIHRDLKPGNVMVTRNGNNVKLIDFGLADTDSHCFHKEPAGTLKYASPEQIEGKELDARSDMYSLGIIISEIAGKRYGKIVSRCTSKDREKRYRSAAEVRSAVAGRSPWILVAAIAAAAIIASLLLASLQPKDTVEDYDSVIQDATQSIIDLQQ